VGLPKQKGKFMPLERMGKKVVVLKRNKKKVTRIINEKLIGRFMKYTRKTNNCWEWIGVKSWKGYGLFSIYNNGEKTRTNAHRISYMMFKNSIPKDMTVHHKCMNRSCVNPDHLELKTNDKNRLQGNCWSAINSRKTHCKHGHPLSDDNLYIHYRRGKRGLSKRRDCKECKRINLRRFRANIKIRKT